MDRSAANSRGMSGSLIVSGKWSPYLCDGCYGDNHKAADNCHYVDPSVYEGCSVSSRTVRLTKHEVSVENQHYCEVVPSLLYMTYHGIIYDVML